MKRTAGEPSAVAADDFAAAPAASSTVAGVSCAVLLMTSSSPCSAWDSFRFASLASAQLEIVLIEFLGVSDHKNLIAYMQGWAGLPGACECWCACNRSRLAKAFAKECSTFPVLH